jgi:uncharacterized damage-inducible protein DinB
MKLNESLLPEFDHEMANTRKTLERIPTDKLDWRPHEKSMTLRNLATHLANLPSWTALAINEDTFDLAPPGAPLPPTPPVNSAEEAVEVFDKNIAAARAALASASDEQLLKPWTLLHGGKTVFTMPKMDVLRGFVMNHSIHHRAQLGVYLRLNDVAVPSIYGPSADESSF